MRLSYILIEHFLPVIELRLHINKLQFNYIFQQDDDYDTVTRRFGTIIGEHESESLLYRLAVVVNKVPHFVARSQPSVGSVAHTHAGGEEGGTGGTGPGTLAEGSHAAVGGGVSTEVSDKNQNNGHTYMNNTLNGNGSSNNLVEKEKSRKERMPSVWERVTEKYRYSEAISHLRNRAAMNGGKIDTRFPQLGIQRSVTAATNASGIRYSNVLYLMYFIYLIEKGRRHSTCLFLD